jgi:hypothetical protein
MKSIRFAFRRPRFPVICAIDGHLIGISSPASLQRRLAALDISGEKELRLVDGSGENWMFLPDQMILAPGFLIRKWRKIEIIRLFNESRNAKESGIRYPEHVIANRRLDTIVRDIAGLISVRKTVQAAFRIR